MIWAKEETLPRAEIEKIQLEKLKQTVHYIYERVEPYRRKMEDAGVKPEDIQSLDDLKKQAEKEGVSDRVIFTGAVPPEEVPAYYQISEAFVSASTSETQGMTFIEALASGLPLFACPDEVLEDLIEETVSGFYFTSPQELAGKVDAYLRWKMRNGRR